MYQFILDANGFLWGPFGVGMLVLVVGVYITFAMKVPWVRHFKDMFKAFKGKAANKGGASPFATVCVAIGGQVGTGNIIGVSTAIASGGPGALFWMWITALVGMSTIMVETLLAQLYKEQNDDGTFRGGAAFYMGNGLKMRWLGIVVAFIIAIGSGIANSMSHVNAITNAFQVIVPNAPALLVGIVLSALAFIICIGGFKRIADFSVKVVPFMAIAYVLLALYVIVTNFSALPAMLGMVFQGAFNPRAVGGGVAGYTIAQAFRYGMARGIFSNEAGQGSTPHQSASGSPMHPAVQSFLGAASVAIDTLLVCTATGIIVLLSGADYTAISGAELAQAAFSVFFGGAAPYIVAIMLFFFAFTSFVASIYGGVVNIGYINESKKVGMIYTVILVVFAALSAVLSVDAMFEISDFVSALMVYPNLFALIFLLKKAKTCLADYEEKRAAGIEEPSYDWAAFRAENGLEPWKEV